MENASKALIIAGAILLSILLISLGIMIFNQASNTVSNSGMTEAEITAFNNKFLKYEGKQTGTMVKSMIQEVIASNANDGAGRKVKVKTSSADTGTTTPSTSAIKNNTKYTVEITYANGLVSEILYY